MIKKRFLRSTLIAALLVAMTLSNVNAITSVANGEVEGRFTARGSLHIFVNTDDYQAAARTNGTMAGCDNISCFVTVVFVAYNTQIQDEVASDSARCTDINWGSCTAITPKVSQVNPSSASGSHTVSTTVGSSTYSWSGVTGWEKPEGLE